MAKEGGCMRLGYARTEQWKRQIEIPGFGLEAQRVLEGSRVVVLGVGGVGCAAALYLAVAGVGELTLVDKDKVSPSNLNRQVLYTWSDVGRPKAETARTRLAQINPALQAEVVGHDVRKDDVARLVKGASFVVESFDTIGARLAANEACVKENVPAVHAFARDLSGELIIVEPGKTACLACALDENFPEEDECPVLGATAGLVGVYAALTAIKYMTGIAPAAGGCRLIFDFLLDRFIKVELPQQTCCPVCGRGQALRGLADG